MAAWRGAPRLRYRGRPGAGVALPGGREHGQRPAEGTDARAGPHRHRDRAGRSPIPRTAVADRDALSRALGRLPADQQLAVHLRLVEGYSFVEVGRVMGRSAGACQMLVLRAGRQLREQLEREGVRVACSLSARRPAGSPRCSTAPSRATPMSPPSRACSAMPRRRRASMSPTWRSRLALDRARPRAPRAVAEVAPPRRRRGLAAAVVLAVAHRARAPVHVGAGDRRRPGAGARGARQSRQVLSVVELVRPGPGQSFPASLRTGWIDTKAGGSDGRSPSAEPSWPRRSSTTGG